MSHRNINLTRVAILRRMNLPVIDLVHRSPFHVHAVRCVSRGRNSINESQHGRYRVEIIGGTFGYRTRI